jgi:SHS2 domain-containing protein
MEKFRIIATTADVGLEVKGEDEANFFKNALRGLHMLLFETPEEHLPAADEPAHFPIGITGDSIENVLVKFLEEILFITYHHQVNVVELNIKKLSNRELFGQVIGIKSPHPALVEVKSVTYHNLKIVRRPGKVSAKVIFDI